jgi:parallel beta-helix repeat protein
VAATVRNNEISHFAYTPGRGIWIRGAGASASQITSNVLTGDDFGGRCILVETSSPTVTNNTTQNCDRGIYVFGASSPSITGNIMGGNDWGFYVDGNDLTPQPVVTGNQFFGNREQNYVATNFATGAHLLRLNATGNWWGTTNPDAIAAEITDLADSVAATDIPTVDFSGFLDGPGGSAVAGNYLIGPLSAASTTLTTGTVYDVVGVLLVPSGKTLVIESGSHLKFHPGTSLIVDGTAE